MNAKQVECTSFELGLAVLDGVEDLFMSRIVALL